jgi:hypothetical protein
MTPTKLRISPSGVPRNMTSPPRAVRGDPQPGLASHSINNMTRAAVEEYRPMRLKPTLEPAAGSVWMMGGCSILECSELHLDRLADRLQRVKVELDADGDLPANQVFGYSP